MQKDEKSGLWILNRHGEVIKPKGTFECAPETELTDEGKKEAAELGLLLKELGLIPEFAFAGPALRCMDTARILLEQVNAIPVTPNKVLGEPKLLHNHLRTDVPHDVLKKATIWGDKLNTKSQALRDDLKAYIEEAWNFIQMIKGLKSTTLTSTHSPNWLILKEALLSMDSNINFDRMFETDSLKSGQGKLLNLDNKEIKDIGKDI